MKEVTNKEVREIAESIVSKTNESDSDYDSVDDVEEILKSMFEKMNIAVKKVKNNPDCKCTDCGCDKK